MNQRSRLCSGIHNIIIRGSRLEQASIHTTEMTAKPLKEINKRKKKLGNIHSQNSILSIEFNKKNRQILNQIYDILVELQA